MNLSDDLVVMGNRAICKSYAKINLTLDIVGKRENGYHDIESIMQSLSLFDLVITDKTDGGINLKTNLKYLPDDSKNIAYKAAELFFEKSGISGGANILIHKNIPVSAGLAGGSGNGAAVLCALNKLYNFPFDKAELTNLSLILGADVPYCITGGTAFACGVGEVLTELPAIPKMTVLLVKPAVGVSTADVYCAYDSCKNIIHPDTAAMKTAVEKGDTQAIIKNIGNAFESVTMKMHPCIGDIKSKMFEYGASASAMCGSGPTVFGIFKDEKAAKAASDKFSKKYSEVYLCKTFN